MKRLGVRLVAITGLLAAIGAGVAERRPASEKLSLLIDLDVSDDEALERFALSVGDLVVLRPGKSGEMTCTQGGRCPGEGRRRAECGPLGGRVRADRAGRNAVTGLQAGRGNTGCRREP